jgi:EthD domain
MIKFMIFIARRKDLSRQEFIDYYETRHVALARRVGLRMADYRRNYVTEAVYDLKGATAARFDFDVITEICFDTRADYEEFKAIHADPDVRKQIEADESKFIDQSKTWTYVVDERG